MRRFFGRTSFANNNKMTDQIYILAQSTSKSLFQTYVLDGGPTMIPVAIVLLALIALTVYNFIMVAKGKFLNNEHQEVVVDSITNVRIRTAILESEEETTFFGRMLKFSLPFIDATDPKLGREKFEESVEEFI